MCAAVVWLHGNRLHQEQRSTAKSPAEESKELTTPRAVCAQVVDVVELDMPPSGCLAPGAAATLRVTFTPKVRMRSRSAHPAGTIPLNTGSTCYAIS
jgi:hypothetical protein